MKERNSCKCGEMFWKVHRKNKIQTTRNVFRSKVQGNVPPSWVSYSSFGYLEVGWAGKVGS